MRRREPERPDIIRVLEHYGADDVPDAGWWRKMRCPFHEDRTASATVITDDGGAFRCFVCDINGDAYTVIMEREGLTFVDALEFYQGLPGEGDDGVRGAAEPRHGRAGLLGQSRNRPTGGRYLPPRGGARPGSRP